MKKIYSLVLLAAVLLLSTNVGATTYTVTSVSDLTTLINGGTLTPDDQVNVTSGLDFSSVAGRTYDFNHATVKMGNDSGSATNCFFYFGGASNTFTFQNAKIINGDKNVCAFRINAENVTLTLENVTIEKKAGIDIRQSAKSSAQIILNGVNDFSACVEGAIVAGSPDTKAVSVSIINNGSLKIGNKNLTPISAFTANITNNDDATMTVTNKFTTAATISIANSGTVVLDGTTHTWGNITGAGTVELKNISLNSNQTISLSRTMTLGLENVSFNECNPAIDVKENAYIIFNNDMDFSSCPTAINVAAGKTVLITNNASLKLGCDASDAPTMSDYGTAKITNQAGATLTITKRFSNAKTISIANSGTVVLDGTTHTWSGITGAGTVRLKDQPISTTLTVNRKMSLVLDNITSNTKNPAVTITADEADVTFVSNFNMGERATGIQVNANASIIFDCNMDFRQCKKAIEVAAGKTVSITNKGTLQVGHENIDPITLTDGSVLNITNEAGKALNINNNFTNAKDVNITNHGSLTVNGNSTAAKHYYLNFQSIVGDGEATISSGIFNNPLSLSNVRIEGGKFAQPLTVSGCTIAGGEFLNTIAANGVTISGGLFTTFKGTTFAVLDGTGISVTGGTFEVEPSANANGIIAGACQFPGSPTGPLIGGLNIHEDYIGTRSGRIILDPKIVEEPVAMNGSQSFNSVQAAIDAAQSGDVIQLIADVTVIDPIWIGTHSVNDAAKSLTLNLAGHTITADASVLNTIILSHGALKITNNVPGEGGIHNASEAKESDKLGGSAIRVHGTWQKGIVSRTAPESELFAYLLIDEGVNLYADHIEGTAISVYEIERGHEIYNSFGLDYTTDVYRMSDTWPRGVANGVRVDVKGHLYAKKYSVKVNGNLRYPSIIEAQDGNGSTAYNETYRANNFPQLGGIDIADTAYVPFVHIFKSAVLEQDPTNGNGAAAYSAGYGHWLIEGQCNGATGLYVKGGEVVLHDAKVTSAWEDEAYIYENEKRGVNSGGNAVVVESVGSYSGQSVVIVEGDTQIETDANGGAALVEIVDADIETKVDSIVIKGGSFTGGENGYAMAISPATITNPEAQVIVYGTTVNSGVNVGGEDDMSSIMAQNTHTTVITNADNTVTVVISTGADPEGETDWANVKNKDDVKWLGFAPVTLGNGTDAYALSLGELQVISGTSGHEQEIVIKDHATLEVEKLILNDYARIIVEAGGTLIVTGDQGVNTKNVNNIVLQTQEGKHATFYFNPATESNKHPQATVQFLSKSYYHSGSDYRNQRFGIPTYGSLQSISAEYQGNPIPTRIWGYFSGQWDLIGTLNGSSPFDASLMNKPFAYYQMNNNNASTGTLITMTGELVGIDNPTLDVTAGTWSTFANSFMANMDAEAMMAMFEGHANIDQQLQTYTPTGENTFAWIPYNFTNILFGEIVNIEPMQAFIIKNNGAADQLHINYTNMVWTPMQTKVNAAPARRRAAAQDMTTARIEVRNAAGVYDYVTMLADDRFSAEYDNGYDAEKILNNTLDLYTVGVTNLATMATDDLKHTILGLACAEAGEYTLTFSHINGEELTLVDRLTGARIPMVEGASYDFVTDANTVNRFEIEGRFNAPTAIENTEAVKKGAVYTITGQFVGSVENWNTLPAGVYVIDGIKCVK